MELDWKSCYVGHFFWVDLCTNNYNCCNHPVDACCILLTPALAGFFCMIWASILIVITGSSFEMPSVNIGISMTHGLVVGLGLILYGLGAKYLPSGELVMLSLLEVVLGIFWAWLPALGINEVPTRNTLIGGLAILVAIILQGFYARKKHLIPMP